MLKVENLVKKYGHATALSGISFSVEAGEVVGFLGPNGAGKSTTMNIITGCLAATAGSVTIDGLDIYEDAVDAKKKIGYLPELPPLYTDMTPDEYLLFVGRAKGLRGDALYKEVERVEKRTGLTEMRARLIKNLSKGYRQRVGIAQALLGDPEILVLDEPTAGLDPEERIRFRGIISDLSQQKLVLLSTHIVSDLEAVANEIILLRKGVVLEMQKPASLLDRLNGQVWLVTVPAADEAALTKQYTCSNVMHTDGKSVIRLLSKSAPRPDAVPTTPNMEDLYLYYFGR